MQNITIARNDINNEALDTDLRSVLGNLVSGISTGPRGVTIHLDDRATPQQIAQVESIVETHDPAVLSPRQQAEQQRQAKLADLRESRNPSFDPADYGSENTLIQTLAQQLAWLEQEVIDLRGGDDEL